VVIDTVSRSVQGDENENDTWLDFYRHTGLLMKQKQIAMIRLDHSGKDESKGQRGGSAKSGDVDAVWKMKKISENGFRITCEANRFPITEKVVDLERVEAPRLYHRRDMRARETAIDEMCKKYAEAKVPRDGSVGVRAAKRMMDEANVTCANGANNRAALAEYCRRLPVFETPELTT
jgi:RecA-family ATPase